MGYHRYEGNTGRSRWVDAPEEPFAPPPPPLPPPSRPRPGPPPARPWGLEQEDLAVLAILWLLYRSSGNGELLVAMGAYLLL